MNPKRSIIIFFFSLVCCLLIGKYFDARFINNWRNQHFKSSRSIFIEKDGHDVVFLGDSRANYGIVPAVFDSITGLNSINMGLVGANAEDLKMLYNAYRENHSAPKFAIILKDFFPFELHKPLEEYYHFYFFLDNDTLLNYAKNRGVPVTAIKYLPFLKYSYFNEKFRKSIFIAPTNFDSIYDKGFYNFSPDTNHWVVKKNYDKIISNVEGMPPYDFEMDKVQVRNFEEMIRLLKSQEVKVYFLSSPYSSAVSAFKNFEKGEYLKDSIYNYFSKKYSIDFIEVPESSIPDKYYYDFIHLNYPGAKLFTRLFAESFKTKEKSSTKE